MVPVQRDGGGEWIDPIMPIWFYTEAEARNWARTWASDHLGFATVYKCVPVADVRIRTEAAFDEQPYSNSDDE